MAVTSWTENTETIYIDVANTANVVLSGATGTVSMPTMKIKYNSSILSDSGRASVTDARLSYGSKTKSWSSGQSAIVGKNTYATVPWSTISIDTADVFSATNKNDSTATGYLKLVPYSYPTGTQIDIAGMGFSTSITRTIVTYTITLDVAPTIGTVTGSYASPQYAGLGTYTANIASASAAYGGDVASVTLTVGPDSVTQTYSSSTISSETIALVPSVAGTYTPTITVEDSRGQTTTTNLTQITVNPYVAPSLNFDVFRTNSSGVKDDEGTYGLITAAVTFTDAVATLTQPAVTIDGTPTNNVTWYSSYSSSTGVSSAISDWTTISSGDTIYGLINGSFSGSQSYVVGVVITDSEGGSSPNITQTLSTAFYTIDFQAGGKEIAFGAPANDNLVNYPDGLFKCAMDFLQINMVGEVKAFAGATIPNGWLLCDGSEVSKATYPLLYNSIGDLWGTPSDPAKFVLPDLMGRVPVGYDANDTDFDTVGLSGGEKAHALIEDELAAHTHGSKALTGTISGRRQGNDYQSLWSTGICSTSAGASNVTSNGVGTANKHADVVTIDATHTHDSVGLGDAHNNLQPYAVVKYIICAA